MKTNLSKYFSSFFSLKFYFTDRLLYLINIKYLITTKKILNLKYEYFNTFIDLLEASKTDKF